MRNKLLFILVFLSTVSFANMANPWFGGATHSSLYTIDNCIVKYEVINIDLSNPHQATYNITYTIYTDKDVTIPLVFIGLRLKEEKSIQVNNAQIKTIPLAGDLSKFTFLQHNGSLIEIKYAEEYSLNIHLEDLIYFKADLQKGSNTIQIHYTGKLEENRFGFVSRSKLEYSLYPSKFWKSFGPIKVNVNLGDDLKITRSNIGDPTINNNTATWEINSINNDVLRIDIKEKVSIISSILLALNPLGIALIIFLIAAYKNYKIIKIKIINKDKNYKYYLPLSVLALTILFYITWYLSFGLIDLSLGGGRNTNHGYYLLFFFTSPLFILVYGIVMATISKTLKKRHP